MKLKALVASAAAMSMVAAPIAIAAPTGAVAQGSAIVLRDGKATIVDAGAMVQAGDRLVSRDSGVEVGFGSCSRDLDSASMLSIDSNACAADVASLSRVSTDLQDSSSITPAVIIGVLAFAAIVGGAVVLADSDDEPESA